MLLYVLCSIDGQISYEEQLQQIKTAFVEVSRASDAVLVEGTGHCAVGSIVNVNNAKVASLLGASMVLIANGGLGTSNYALCDGVFASSTSAAPLTCLLPRHHHHHHHHRRISV